jgi:hypothetical protein
MSVNPNKRHGLARGESVALADELAVGVIMTALPTVSFRQQ